MDTAFAGTPSDVCPPILATGTTDARLVFLSLSRRGAVGRDAEYLAWHTMDHRPEQYRISGIRHSLRVVSTPECRAARAASVAEYDDVDHVVAYMFTGPEPIPASINSTWRWSTMADSSRSCRPWDLWLAMPGTDRRTTRCDRRGCGAMAADEGALPDHRRGKGSGRRPDRCTRRRGYMVVRWR